MSENSEPLLNGMSEEGGVTPTPSLNGDETPRVEMQVTDVCNEDELMEVEEVGPALRDFTEQKGKCYQEYS
mgnify:CR=1 FL=1